MKKILTIIIVVCVLLLASAFINRVYAAEESFLNKFLGSPLLIITAIITIDIIAYLYRKIRK